MERITQYAPKWNCKESDVIQVMQNFPKIMLALELAHGRVSEKLKGQNMARYCSMISTIAFFLRNGYKGIKQWCHGRRQYSLGIKPDDTKFQRGTDVKRCYVASTLTRSLSWKHDREVVFKEVEDVIQRLTEPKKEISEEIWKEFDVYLDRMAEKGDWKQRIKRNWTYVAPANSATYEVPKSKGGASKNPKLKRLTPYLRVVKYREWLVSVRLFFQKMKEENLVRLSEVAFHAHVPQRPMEAGESNDIDQMDPDDMASRETLMNVLHEANRRLVINQNILSREYEDVSNWLTEQNEETTVLRPIKWLHNTLGLVTELTAREWKMREQEDPTKGVKDLDRTFLSTKFPGLVLRQGTLVLDITDSNAPWKKLAKYNYALQWTWKNRNSSRGGISVDELVPRIDLEAVSNQREVYQIARDTLLRGGKNSCKVTVVEEPQGKLRSVTVHEGCLVQCARHLNTALLIALRTLITNRDLLDGSEIKIKSDEIKVTYQSLPEELKKAYDQVYVHPKFNYSKLEKKLIFWLDAFLIQKYQIYLGNLQCEPILSFY
jgi:hypothetical protein